MFIATLMSAAVLTGFSLSWSSTPAQDDQPGSAVVIVEIQEDDLLAVISDEGPEVSWEITSTIDGGGFLRSGGRGVNTTFPISEELEYSDLEPGGHMVSVSLTDLESGTVRRLSEEVFIDSFGDMPWSPGGLRVTPAGRLRASGNITVSWIVYMTQGEEVPPAAYSLMSGSTEVLRDGWFTGEITEPGVIEYTASIPLDGLSKGRYRITAVVLSDESVLASSNTSVSLLDSWDVWGDDPEVTATLIRPIASAHELRELERAGGQGDRNSVMADFWNRRDPNPSVRGNEYLAEYLLRLDYISREFSTLGSIGINTDRGVVYAKLGEPDIIENFPFELGDYPYITWEYFTPSLSLTFVDQGGYGFYELVESWEDVSRAFNSREEWSQ